MPSFLYFLNGSVLDFFFFFLIYSTQLSWLLSGGVVVCLYVITLFPLFCVFLLLKKEKKKINLYIYNLELKQNIIITLDDYLLS